MASVSKLAAAAARIPSSTPSTQTFRGCRAESSSLPSLFPFLRVRKACSSAQQNAPHVSSARTVAHALSKLIPGSGKGSGHRYPGPSRFVSRTKAQAVSPPGSPQFQDWGEPVCSLKFVVTRSKLESHLPGKEEEAEIATGESDLVSTTKRHEESTAGGQVQESDREWQTLVGGWRGGGKPH